VFSSHKAVPYNQQIAVSAPMSFLLTEVSSPPLQFLKFQIPAKLSPFSAPIIGFFMVLIDTEIN